VCGDRPARTVLRGRERGNALPLPDRHLFIHWDEGEGYGGPAISCKRPYGNSAVPENVAEILGLPEDRMLRVHVEAGIALKVVLAAGEFRPGRYCREGDYGWRRVGDRP